MWGEKSSKIFHWGTAEKTGLQQRMWHTSRNIQSLDLKKKRQEVTEKEHQIYIIVCNGTTGPQRDRQHLRWKMNSWDPSSYSAVSVTSKIFSDDESFMQSSVVKLTENRIKKVQLSGTLDTEWIVCCLLILAQGKITHDTSKLSKNGRAFHQSWYSNHFGIFFAFKIPPLYIALQN